jgi:hypothetical protein
MDTHKASPEEAIALWEKVMEDHKDDFLEDVVRDIRHTIATGARPGEAPTPWQQVEDAGVNYNHEQQFLAPYIACLELVAKVGRQNFLACTSGPYWDPTD